VFVSGQPNVYSGWSAPLYVLNSDGTLKTTVAVSGASGMVLQGGSLYVLRCEADQIDVVDTATLAISESISLGETTTLPCDLALAGGRLWFATPAPSVGRQLSSATLASPHTVSDTQIDPGAGVIAGQTDDANLVIFPSGDVMSLDASTASPSVIATRSFATTLNTHSMSADGSVVTANFSLPVMSVPALTDIAGYPDTGEAAAFSSDAGWMASAITHQVPGSSPPKWVTDVAVTAKGAASPVTSTSLRVSERVFAMAMAPDLSYLYALAQDDAGQTSLVAIPAPTLPRPTLTIARSKASITSGGAVTVTATLSVSDPTGVVQIWRKPVGGTAVLAAQGPVGADHRFSALLRPRASSSFFAVLLSDSQFGPATSTSVKVGVRVRVTVRALGAYGRSGKYHLYHYTSRCPQRHRGCPAFTASVAPNHAGKPIVFRVDVFVSGRWRLALTAKALLGTRSKSTIRLIYRSTALIGVRTRILAEFPHDTDHLGNHSPWSYLILTH
jgi:hypothetical protein